MLVTEAAVSASRPVRAGRIYAEIRGAVNTGLAFANPNDQPATISFYFTDDDGRNFGEGSVTLDSNRQIARFLDQSPFNGTAPLTGTFSFTSSLPIGVTALRGKFNERSEFLITTLPIAELEPARPARGTLLPQFAEGAGWATEVILINHSDSPMSGAIEFFDPGSPNASGQPITLTINGLTASRFDYQLPPRSARRFATSGESVAIRSGSVRIMPSADLPPTAVAIFAFRREGVVVSEAGVAAVEPTQAFHLHAEMASALTGIAVANAASTPASIEFELTQVDGSRLGPESRIVMPGNGQVAVFLNQIKGFDTVTLPFTGVLRVSTDSVSGIAVTGLRGITNERGDFLITSTPALDDASSETNAELVFSHFADGGGYTTQFVVLAGSAGRVSSGVVRFVGSSGRPALFEESLSGTVGALQGSNANGVP